MLVYTKVISEEQEQQFYIMACSFLAHHPNRVLYCQTDLNMKHIPHVVYVGRFYNIEQHDTVFCFASPYITFLGNIDEFLDQQFNECVYPNLREEVRNDFYVYTKSSRKPTSSQLDNLLNTSLPAFCDGAIAKEYRTYASGCSALNTREFKPWIKQRNSYKTLIFPWERYYDAMAFAVPYLADEFIDSVIDNCKRHPYMLFYLESGALSWRDSSH